MHREAEIHVQVCKSLAAGLLGLALHISLVLNQRMMELASCVVALFMAASGNAELLLNDAYLPKAEELIGTARKSVTIGMYLMSKGDRISEVERCLAAAVKRGVAVQVILEQSAERNDDITQTNRETAATLKLLGVPVFFDRPERRSHLKVIVVDRRYVLLGSHNLTNSAMEKNNEASVLYDDTSMAVKLESFIISLKEDTGQKSR